MGPPSADNPEEERLQYTSLVEIAKEHPGFEGAFSRWSDQDVAMYLQAIVGLPENRDKSLQEMREQTGIALCLAYHERVEMDKIQVLMDVNKGKGGYFHNALEQGTLSNEDFWYPFGFGDRLMLSCIYFEAHHEASKEELMFAQFLARQFGYDLSLASLAFTKPNWVEVTFSPTLSLEQYYDAILTWQLGIAAGSDFGLMPCPEEVACAKAFWEATGTEYPESVREFLTS